MSFTAAVAMAWQRFKSIGHYRLADLSNHPGERLTKALRNHGLSLSEGMVAETPASVKSESTLSSARARSNSAFTITMLSSAINTCITGLPDIQLLNPSPE
jgi:hypothetical protein